MGGFEYREPLERTPEYWQDVEAVVDEMITASDIAIHALMNRILEKVREDNEK